MSSTIYLAAPLFTPHQKSVIAEVQQIMETEGFTVFSPLEESKDIWRGRPPAECGSEERQAVMQMNCRGILNADLLFAWLGGWDPARVLWEHQERYVDQSSDDESVMPYPKMSLDGYRRFVPALPDTGVVWEMGYAFRHRVPTLAYLHESDGDRSFNLMLSETVDAVARGNMELREKLHAFMTASTDFAGSLASEGEDFSG